MPGFTFSERSGLCVANLSYRARSSVGLEQRISNPQVAGSSPAERAKRSARPIGASHNSGERLPSSDAAVSRADTLLALSPADGGKRGCLFCDIGVPKDDMGIHRANGNEVQCTLSALKRGQR